MPAAPLGWQRLAPGPRKRKPRMNLKLPGLLAAALVTAAVPAAIAIAQAPAPGAERPRLSAETRARLLEGRIAMAKTALKLRSDQLKLWAPVEKHLRTTAAEREQRWRNAGSCARSSGSRARHGSGRPWPTASTAPARRTARARRAHESLRGGVQTLLCLAQRRAEGRCGRGAAAGGRRGFRGRGERWALRRASSDGPDASQVPQVAPKR